VLPKIKLRDELCNFAIICQTIKIDLDLNGLSLNMIHDSTFSINSQSRSYLIGKGFSCFYLKFI